MRGTRVVLSHHPNGVPRCMRAWTNSHVGPRKSVYRHRLHFHHGSGIGCPHTADPSLPSGAFHGAVRVVNLAAICTGPTHGLTMQVPPFTTTREPCTPSHYTSLSGVCPHQMVTPTPLLAPIRPGYDKKFCSPHHGRHLRYPCPHAAALGPLASCPACPSPSMGHCCLQWRRSDAWPGTPWGRHSPSPSLYIVVWKAASRTPLQLLPLVCRPGQSPLDHPMGDPFFH